MRRHANVRLLTQPSLLVEALPDRVALLRRETVPTLEVVFELPPLRGRKLLILLVALLIEIPILLRHAVPVVHPPAHGILLIGRQGLPFPVLALHATLFLRRKVLKSRRLLTFVLGEIWRGPVGRCAGRTARKSVWPGFGGGGRCRYAEAKKENTREHQHDGLPPRLSGTHIMQPHGCFHQAECLGSRGSALPGIARCRGCRRFESVSLSYPYPAKGQGV